MKRLGLIFIILTLLIGCATTPKVLYVIPQYIKDRPATAIFRKAGTSMGIKSGSKLYINGSKTPNAYVNAKHNIYITEGLFQYDDDTLAFAIVHELCHVKLSHVRKIQAVSVATTAGMLILNVFVPGAGLLNHAVNPAITNNFSKSQEFAADRLASEILLKYFNISIERQIQILRNIQKDTPQGGGFWSDHPSWDERIANIQKQ